MTENTHTASKNVSVLNEAFFIPQLNRSRRIWLYLPEGYATSKKRYPVLYMHDGQNLFDDATSFSGEWGIDETLDAAGNACIVVGIENGSLLRINEYNPNDTEAHGKGEGFLYLDFIVKTLKPYVDKKLRTLSAKKYTIIAGSSMGGLISFYAGLLYPRVFGKMGIFSPAFWIVPGIDNQVEQLVKARGRSDQQYYFYGGGQENPTLVSDISQMAALLQKKSGAKIAVKINPEGWHNEVCWRKEFPAFYEWVTDSTKYTSCHTS